MALAENRKLSILIGWFFLVGLISGIFFSRLSEEKKQKDIWSLSFSTQSVGWDSSEVVDSLVYEVPCPWSEEILQWGRVIVWNPLVEQALPLLSMQQWIVSENYILQWPTSLQINWWSR